MLMTSAIGVCALHSAPTHSRRAVLTNAAAAAVTTSLPLAAQAKGAIEGDFIKDLPSAVAKYSVNEEGDAAVYKPKARIEAAGSKSSKVKMYMPDPGPLSNGDFVDAMWFRDSTGKVLGAEQYRSTGKSFTEPVEGVKGKSIEPSFQARVDAGAGTIFPVIHSAKGSVWEGKPIVVK